VRYIEREPAIVEIARGKRVLHLGCVGHSPGLSTRSRINLATRGLHARLTAVADVTGVDLSEDVIDVWREHGVFDNVLVGDVERLDTLHLEGPFDVIVAGDIIEHLSNPGAMLRGVRTLAGPRTTLVLTTPHSFGLPNFLRFTLGRFEEGDQHVATYNETNLRNLLARHGFHVDRVDTCHQSAAARSGGLAFRLGRILLRRFPRFGGTLFLVAHPQPTEAPPLTAGDA
jgi:2-polyprenyl-3-methyl-5-hydroxy-6-metoxy-1,4-benzoquinol methylase